MRRDRLSVIARDRTRQRVRRIAMLEGGESALRQWQEGRAGQRLGGAGRVLEGLDRA